MLPRLRSLPYRTKSSSSLKAGSSSPKEGSTPSAYPRLVAPTTPTDDRLARGIDQLSLAASSTKPLGSTGGKEMDDAERAKHALLIRDLLVMVNRKYANELGLPVNKAVEVKEEMMEGIEKSGVAVSVA
jgi:hypothetical protein